MNPVEAFFRRLGYVSLSLAEARNAAIEAKLTSQKARAEMLGRSLESVTASYRSLSLELAGRLGYLTSIHAEPDYGQGVYHIGMSVIMSEAVRITNGDPELLGHVVEAMAHQLREELPTILEAKRAEAFDRSRLTGMTG